MLLLAAVAAYAGPDLPVALARAGRRAGSTQIGGAQRITSEQTSTRSSGIDGRNILLLKPDEVAARVKAMPGVAKVGVHVRLPNQVIIDVTRARAAGGVADDHEHGLAGRGRRLRCRRQARVPPLQFVDQSEGG